MAPTRCIRVLFTDTIMVTVNGEDVPKKFIYGEMYPATLIELNEDGYANIHLADGSIIYGLREDAFEKKRVNVKLV